MLADETDFIDLYGKLRLEPDCSLADFKQAYRRHVSAWHPDRRSRGARADALAARRLQRLMAQYSAAMDFHKRHGRLPGAARPTPSGAAVVAMTPNLPVLFVGGSVSGGDDAAAVQESADVESVVGRVGPEVSPIARKRAPTTGGRVVLVGGLVLVIALVWTLVPASEDGEMVGEGVPTVVAAVAAPVVETATLGVGMKDNEVAALEGEPTLRSADRWEYGPSWVRFEGGSVVDWYSSPLRTLHVRSSHPPR